MKDPFKTIGIIGRLRNPGVKETLQTLIHYLAKLQQNFYIEEETAESLQPHTFPTLSREQLGVYCNLLIVVGGDGSLLNAAHAVIEYETPILGINRGSLGFLTDIHPTDLAKIAHILKGHYYIEKRFLLTVEVWHNNTLLGQDNVLNEVALIPGEMPHMVAFEIFINNQFVCSQASDGLVVTTPTGSTAYALSCGGPILHPQLDVIALVPICPHNLSSRPLVVDGKSALTITISSAMTLASRISCDGQKYIGSPPGSHIKIYKKEKALSLLHPLDYDYYTALRSKLLWGNKLQQKESAC